MGGCKAISRAGPEAGGEKMARDTCKKKHSLTTDAKTLSVHNIWSVSPPRGEDEKRCKWEV